VNEAVSKNKKKPNTAVSSKKAKACKKIVGSAAAPSADANNCKGNKKRGGKSTAGSSNNNAKLKKQKIAQSTAFEMVITSLPTSSNALDLFERHSREFERSITRLEKSDAYRFFTDDFVPPEFDECYSNDKKHVTTNAAVGAQQPQQSASFVSTPDLPYHDVRPSTLPLPSSLPLSDVASDATAISAVTQESPEKAPSPSCTTEQTKKECPNGMSSSSVTFPDHPPFNFVVLRKRLENGRYILDREQLEIEERINLMTPYLKSIGQKIPTKKKWRNFPVRHKQGINWDLFRKDVIGMCDAAIERNPEHAGDGTPGTLRNAAHKIKDLLEQIYDKTARKHALEIEVSNDAHRFNLAIENTPNTEAAMQGKKWRREGENKVCSVALVYSAGFVLTFIRLDSDVYFSLQRFLNGGTKN
jgi:hypothetical protein